jgi:hypothetical protein
MAVAERPAPVVLVARAARLRCPWCGRVLPVRQGTVARHRPRIPPTGAGRLRTGYRLGGDVAMTLSGTAPPRSTRRGSGAIGAGARLLVIHNIRPFDQARWCALCDHAR